MIVKITKADLMRGKVLAPNWYKVTVVGHEIKHAKSDANSLNYVYTFRFPAVDNYELDHTFNTKALGFIAPFIAAIRNTNVTEIANAIQGESFDFDTDEPLGKELQVKIANEPYEGRLTNKVKEFMPAGATVPF